MSSTDGMEGMEADEVQVRCNGQVALVRVQADPRPPELPPTITAITENNLALAGVVLSALLAVETLLSSPHSLSFSAVSAWFAVPKMRSSHPPVLQYFDTTSTAA